VQAEKPAWNALDCSPFNSAKGTWSLAHLKPRFGREQ
jgi:hypothetical protein